MTTQENNNTEEFNTKTHQEKVSLFTKMHWCGPDQYWRPMMCKRRWFWPIRILITLLVLGGIFSLGKHAWMMNSMYMTEHYTGNHPMVRNHMQPTEQVNPENIEQTKIEQTTTANN